MKWLNRLNWFFRPQLLCSMLGIFLVYARSFVLSGEKSGCCWHKTRYQDVLLLSCDICWLKYEFSVINLLGSACLSVVCHRRFVQ